MTRVSLIQPPKIPVLDTAHPPEYFGDRSLVRFRAMVQDTSGNPEMFLANLPDGKPGGWGLESSNIDGADHPIDYASLRECQVMWAVSIPGESEWCSHELDGDVGLSCFAHIHNGYLMMVLRYIPTIWFVEAAAQEA
jgi:hypothetical protein